MGLTLRNHYQAFAIVASLTKTNNGPVVLLPTSQLGLEAWNAARRPSKSVIKRVFEGKGYSRSPGMLPGSSESSDADDNGTFEDDSATITPNSGRNRSSSGGLSSVLSGRRSRSNTTTTTNQQAVVVDSGVRGEETRRLAGAGARDGLGRGLLS